MKFAVLSLFPEVITGGLVGLVGSAKEKGLYELQVCDLRAFGKGTHKALDDVPYGGGDGMLLQAEPLKEALEHIRTSDPSFKEAKVICLSPKGKLWTQREALLWAKDASPKILVCGRYAGLDQRFIEECCDEEISIGDYILNGGELGALVIMESVIRLQEGALGNAQSSCVDSFSQDDGLLEAPQYTRPRQWQGREVPEVLLSGHHDHITKWTRYMALLETGYRRPELLTLAVWEELCELLNSKDTLAVQTLKDFGESKVQELKKRVRNRGESYGRG
ncbi:MAG: tRNA (guanosine(37)-N1)-methyltransferase TrmD [Bdellovibrionaceae bacterium]|nr:tRNA (guanosine(37)-N1)-methyltransferase TrmD [Pseudobdellovibrionaceae bacterium]